MAPQQTGSFGSWTSPITADAAVAETGSLTEPRIDGDIIYWIEGRPLEKGRNVVVARAADGTIRDITPSPFNVRSQVLPGRDVPLVFCANDGPMQLLECRLSIEEPCASDSQMAHRILNLCSFDCKTVPSTVPRRTHRRSPPAARNSGNKLRAN